MSKPEDGSIAKSIVILNGSPRQKGNTSMLVKAFTEGAESAGHTVTEFFLGGMDIHGCKGCFGGHSGKECPCVQHDDMDKIYPAVRGSDVVVLASPLFQYLSANTSFAGFGMNPMSLVLKGVVKKMDKDYKNNGNIKWNFTKFLIDREGKIVARFEPTEAMDHVKARVEEIL